MLLLPFLFLLLLEMALRLAGFGYPTGFFLPSRAGPPGTFTENQRFGWRFFPPAVARAPDPLVVSLTKPENSIRIFVLGESAALGDPEPAYGFGRILEVLLTDRYAGRRFEVINVSMTAINSHVILPMARNCAPFGADFWIVYMGNNEVVGPFGPGSVFGRKAAGAGLVRANLLFKTARVGQLFDRALDLLRPSGSPAQWEGMKMMLDARIRSDAPAIQTVRQNFQHNLNGILSAAERGGSRVILCTVAANLQDCPPFASAHRNGLSGDEEAQWKQFLAAGMAAEERGEYPQAIASYQQAARLDPEFAELSFRVGRCLAAMGARREALLSYRLARDFDTLRFRADSTVNDILRKTAAERRGGSARMLDLATLIENLGPGAAPGTNAFLDHVHFNFQGNYQAALALAREVGNMLPGKTGEIAAGQEGFLSMAACADRLALTDWDQSQMAETMWKRFREAPFTGQLGHAETDSGWLRQIQELKTKIAKSGFAPMIEIYREALRRRPEDWVLHDRFANLLEAAGDLNEAEKQWRSVVEVRPQYAPAHFKLGSIYARQGKARAAEECYAKVLALRPSSVEAMNELGLLYASQGEADRAVAQFQRALAVKPNFAGAQVNWGLLLAGQGKLREAEDRYKEALRLDPGSASAQINLGKLLSGQQRHAEAIACYSNAVKLKPAEAMIHYNLANSLSASDQRADAIWHYGEAVRLKPDFSEAHFNLGVALAKAARFSEASVCFREAVHLDPNDPQAHFYLGTALAKQQRLAEAAVEFRETLRLDPNNAVAKKYLEAALKGAAPSP